MVLCTYCVRIFNTDISYGPGAPSRGNRMDSTRCQDLQECSFKKLRVRSPSSTSSSLLHPSSCHARHYCSHRYHGLHHPHGDRRGTIIIVISSSFPDPRHHHHHHHHRVIQRLVRQHCLHIDSLDTPDVKEVFSILLAARQIQIGSWAEYAYVYIYIYIYIYMVAPPSHDTRLSIKPRQAR